MINNKHRIVHNDYRHSILHSRRETDRRANICPLKIAHISAFGFWLGRKRNAHEHSVCDQPN